MNKLIRVCVLISLSTISASFLYADSYNFNSKPSQNDENPQSVYRQDINSDKRAPNMSEERSFVNQSRNRFDQLKQENLDMIEQDQKMMKKGYDPNENYL